MRHATTPFALMLLALSGPVAAEATRTVHAELSSAESGRFAVENLAGSMRITTGGDRVVVTATVHGETDALAASLQFERRTGKAGEPLLRLKYPVAETRAFRYPGAHGTSEMRYSESGDTDDHWWGGGQRVTVSDHKGTLLFADVEVQVPAKSLEAGFFNRVGPIEAIGVHGTLRFDTAGGDVTLAHVEGDVVADTGSGDVSASDGSGTLRCDTGSGECEVTHFNGERLSVDTGSGNLKLRGVKCREIDADTGSGDVLADDVEVDSFKADTGSGSVTLRLPRDASFEMHADTGSGEIVSRFKDAEPIVRRREVVGYRRGDGRVKIDLDTGSGDVRIEPVD